MKKLVGMTDMEDGLARLDQLTQDEVRMAVAQGLKATHDVDKKVQVVIDSARFFFNYPTNPPRCSLSF